MAKVEYGSITVLSTGPEIVTLNDMTLTPDKIVLFVANSSDEASAGYSDLTVKFSGSSRYGDENITHPITHYRNIGGTKTKTFEANVTYFDTGEFGVSVTTCTQTTNLKFVVFEA